VILLDYLLKYALSNLLKNHKVAIKQQVLAGLQLAG